MSPSLKHLEINKNEDLNERAREILFLLVECHIKNEVPISSLYLNRYHNINLSSASIRSIMSALENYGYLYSPHRSAGRIPTSKAYQYYIKQMVVPTRSYMQTVDESYIQSEFLKHDLGLLEDILICTARILSFVTNYATLIFGPKVQTFVLKHLEIIDMGGTKLLVLAVTRSGDVFSHKAFVEERIPQSILRDISFELSQKYNGMDLSELILRIQKEQTGAELPSHYALVYSVLERYFKLLSQEGYFYKDGFDFLSKNLNKESYEHISSIAQSNAWGAWKEWMEQDAHSLSSDIQILVTDDRASNSRIKGISVIAGSYKMGGENIGSIYVIGPVCMNYPRVITLVIYIKHLLSNMITRITN